MIHIQAQTTSNQLLSPAYTVLGANLMSHMHIQVFHPDQEPPMNFIPKD